jgi:maltodextrin utilization protein YvdJ
MQLQPLNTITSLLLVTGVSFPSIAPLINVYAHAAVPAIILALLNIGTIIYLSNNHIKTQFQKQKPTQTNNTPL